MNCLLRLKSGTLRKNLEKQVKRMLKHPKARALVDNFAGQWLQIRSLSSLTPKENLSGVYDGTPRVHGKGDRIVF